MKDDYRNYLFESFVKIVDYFKPRAFVFENVPGLLSACPGDKPVRERIYEAFDSIGYEIRKPDELKKSVYCAEDFDVPHGDGDLKCIAEAFTDEQRDGGAFFIGIAERPIRKRTQVITELYAPASAVAVKVLGNLGGQIVSVGIIVSVFGSCNGFILSGSRVAYSLAYDLTFSYTCIISLLSTEILYVTLL